MKESLNAQNGLSDFDLVLHHHVPSEKESLNAQNGLSDFDQPGAF